jgi:hypothetical protein
VYERPTIEQIIEEGQNDAQGMRERNLGGTAAAVVLLLVVAAGSSSSR